MNKAAIKNFAIWARNKLIAEITYKAGLLGITEKGISNPQPQSTNGVQFFDIGTKEPYSITGVEIEQRRNLVDIIQRKEKQSDYKTAHKSVIEEVAYTWFNRLIAVRFMEVNDYLPSRIRVLSSESSSKIEPDLVTSPFEADLEFAPYENERIIQLKNDNKLDELFRMLFIKLCNALNAILPELFEKTNHYTELLMNVSFTDKDGVVYRLVHDIPEDDFNVDKEGQVEIIGWLYQYYNTEPKDEAFDLLKKNVKITKERIPAATQLFTPDWIVRYMVENSLGRLWIEGHPNNELKARWKYYLDEAEQESAVRAELDAIRDEYKSIKPEEIKVIDPCMGSGHILVYAFDVLMQIYESYGYGQRDAAKSILENNLFGLDIDNRAYQLAYFAVMMKARQYNRRILSGETRCNLFAFHESNEFNRSQLQYFGHGMSNIERNMALNQIEYLLDTMHDAKDYGSILNINDLNWDLLYQFIENNEFKEIGLNNYPQEQLRKLVEISTMIVQKYDVVVTNPPFMGISNGNGKLNGFVKKYYPESKADLFSVFMEKCIKLTKKFGYTSMITMQSWMFLSSFEMIRKFIMMKTISSLVHIGYNSFPEINSKVAQAVTFVIRNNTIQNYRGKYLDLTSNYPQAYDKEKAFLFEVEKGGIIAAQNQYLNIPGIPIVYWLSKQSFNNFSEMETIGEYIEPRIGLITGDNERFLRYWFEVDRLNVGFGITSIQESIDSRKKWFPYQKGGEFRKWFGNQEYVVLWENNGYEMKFNNSIDGRVRSHNYNGDYSFVECITWTSVTTGTFACRFAPKGFLFDSAGPICRVKDHKNLTLLLSLLSSIVAQYYLKVINPTINFPPGYIMSIPFSMKVADLYKERIQLITDQCISISQQDWDAFEASWNFSEHPFLKYRAMSNLLLDTFNQWEKFTESQFIKLKGNEEELNSIFIEIYGLQNELNPEVKDKDVTIRKADLGRDVRSFISYSVGCIFGRYSLDMNGLYFAGGEWDISKYRTYKPDRDNVVPITDEEYFEDDIVGLFCAFLKKTFGEDNLEENLDFIAKALGNKGNTSREVIRNYFLNDFFKDHCRIYQKRPIYWLFDSGKANGFKALIYLHRYNVDTIGNLRIDYLHRMQRVYESEIARMQDSIDNSNNAREVAAATKRKEKLTRQLKETKDYDEKIAHLALARVPIDLDDGVKVNYDKIQTGTDDKKLDVLAKI